MHMPARRIGTRLASIGAVIFVAACGGSSSPTSPSTPKPAPTPAPVQTLVRQGSTSGLLANYIQPVRFTTASAGRIDAIADWTFATDKVELVVATGSNACFTGTYIDFRTCNVIATVNDSSKPKKISLPGQPAGPYTLYIWNRGTQTEAVSFQIFVTTPG
jgi:hypothetical protein